MSNLLEHPIYASDETADGRFFITSEQSTVQLFDASKQFREKNAHQLPEGGALIHETTLQPSAIDIPPPSSNGQKLARLIFERESGSNIYRWQNIESYEAKAYGYPEIKQRIWEVSVAPNAINGKEYAMDQAGNLLTESGLCIHALMQYAHTLQGFLNAKGPEQWLQHCMFQNAGFIALKPYDPLIDNNDKLAATRLKFARDQLPQDTGKDLR